MPLKHVKQSGCMLAHHFSTLFLLSLHLVPAEGHFSCGIPTLGTQKGCGKQSGMGVSLLLTWTTEDCTYLPKSFSRATMQHLIRFQTCPFLAFFYDSLWETSQKLQNLGDFAHLFFYLWINLFLLFVLLVGFLSAFCKLLPFSNCLTEHCFMTQSQQAKYWMVKCYFLKQYGTACHQEMDHGQRHWEKSHHHLKSVLALDITFGLMVLIVLNQNVVT